MDKELEKKLEQLRLDKLEKLQKKEEECIILHNIEYNGWVTRHFRTENYGNITVLYRLIGLRYLYEVRYSFCSPIPVENLPLDSFCKRDGRLEADKNRVFTMYLPPSKPKCDRITLQNQIDKMLLGFIQNIVDNAVITSGNRHSYELYFGFPRWIKEFLENYNKSSLTLSWDSLTAYVRDSANRNIGL